MAAPRRKKSSRIIPITVCDKCQRRYCPHTKQEHCAYLECMALAEGREYTCPDQELDYWSRMDAA
jgi:hypothetical protein